MSPALDAHSKGPYNCVLDVRDMYYLAESTYIAQSAQGHLCHGIRGSWHNSLTVSELGFQWS